MFGFTPVPPLRVVFDDLNFLCPSSKIQQRTHTVSALSTCNMRNPASRRLAKHHRLPVSSKTTSIGGTALDQVQPFRHNGSTNSWKTERPSRNSKMLLMPSCVHRRHITGIHMTAASSKALKSVVSMNCRASICHLLSGSRVFGRLQELLTGASD